MMWSSTLKISYTAGTSLASRHAKTGRGDRDGDFANYMHSFDGVQAGPRKRKVRSRTWPRIFQRFRLCRRPRRRTSSLLLGEAGRREPAERVVDVAVGVLDERPEARPIPVEVVFRVGDGR